MKTNKSAKTTKSFPVLFGLFLAVLAGATTSANAIPIYDNLGATSSGQDQILFRGPLFDSFTPLSGGTLSGIQLALGNFGPPGAAGALSVGLYSLSTLDSSAVPTLLTSLGTIDNSAITVGGIHDYSLSLTANPLLTAGTRYWIGLSDFSDGAITWSWSSDISGPGLDGEYWAFGGGVVRPNTSGGPYQMAVSVNVPDHAIPPPCWLWAPRLLPFSHGIRTSRAYPRGAKA